MAISIHQKIFADAQIPFNKEILACKFLGVNMESLLSQLVAKQTKKHRNFQDFKNINQEQTLTNKNENTNSKRFYLLNLGSAYASGLLIISPVVATAPAIPLSIENLQQDILVKSGWNFDNACVI